MNARDEPLQKIFSVARHINDITFLFKVTGMASGIRS
jgi:hypothetical protein